MTYYSGAFIWQARWALSQDEQLQKHGLYMGIDWFREFELYLEYLIKGLQMQSQCPAHFQGVG